MIERVELKGTVLDIRRDLSITTRNTKPGPPERIDGMTMGFVRMSEPPPHGGEVHPDGDELLFVIEGRLRVRGDSAPDTPTELGPGEACIVRRGEWHRVEVVEPAYFIHLTPGPNGDHRPR